MSLQWCPPGSRKPLPRGHVCSALLERPDLRSLKVPLPCFGLGASPGHVALRSWVLWHGALIAAQSRQGQDDAVPRAGTSGMGRACPGSSPCLALAGMQDGETLSVESQRFRGHGTSRSASARFPRGGRAHLWPPRAARFTWQWGSTGTRGRPPQDSREGLGFRPGVVLPCLCLRRPAVSEGQAAGRHLWAVWNPRTVMCWRLIFFFNGQPEREGAPANDCLSETKCNRGGLGGFQVPSSRGCGSRAGSLLSQALREGGDAPAAGPSAS